MADYQSDEEQDERIHMGEKCDGRGGLDRLQIECSETERAKRSSSMITLLRGSSWRERDIRAEYR